MHKDDDLKGHSPGCYATAGGDCPKCNKGIYESALDTQVGGDWYSRYAIQPVVFIDENNIGFIRGNMIKYICRLDVSENPERDGRKIIQYDKIYLERRYGIKL